MASQRRPVAPAGVPARTGWGVLRSYRRPWLRADLIAGLTVGAMLIPQSMAYAELAGAPPTAGLYSALLAPVAYALVGTSRHLGTGPEPGTAILAGAGVAAAGVTGDPARYLFLLSALALLVAGVAALARILRLGFIANLLSKPVLVGYITGVGLVLVSSQLQALTGIPVDAQDFFARIARFAQNLGELSVPTLLVGGGTFVVIMVLRRWAPALPSALIAVAGATAVSVALDLPQSGVSPIGAVPSGLPALGVPDVAFPDLWALLPAALGITLVGYTDNVLTARSIAARMGYRIDADQELTGLAAANLAAGLSQGIPVSSSASRTAVPASLGSVTSLVGIIAAAIVAITLLVAGGALAAVPRAALAAVVLSAAIAIIDVPGFQALRRISVAELGLAVATALGVMTFGVLAGVLLAVGLSILVALARVARPSDSVLGERADLDGWVDVDHDGSARTLPGLLVYRFDAPLFFLNTERFRERLLHLLGENPGTEEWVILDFEGIGDIDATAVDGLGELLDDLRAQDVATVAVARANHPSLRRLEAAGLLVPTGPLWSFPTINAAVRAFEHRAEPK